MGTEINANVNSDVDTDNKFSIKQALFISVLSIVFMLFLAIVFGTRWETNDDPALAKSFSENAYYCIFVGKTLSAFIHSFYAAFPELHFNWWLGFSLLSVCVGLAALLYVLLRKNTKKTALFLSLFVFFAGWYFTVSQMNFTRTAMALSVGGTALITYALYLNRKSHKAILWVVGLFFLLVGREIRYQSAYIALLFLAGNGAVFLFRQKGFFRKEWFGRNAVSIVFLAFCLCAVLLGTKINNMLLTPQEHEEKVYHAARSRITDFTPYYPEYYSHLEEYWACGISYNDLSLLQAWIDEDPDFFTLERLNELGKLRREPRVQSGIKTVVINFFSLPFGWLIMLLAILVLLIDFKKNYLPVAFAAFFTLFAFVYLIRLGRINTRALECIYWGTLTSIWISSDYSINEDKVQKKLKYIICLCLILWTGFAMSTVKFDKLVPFAKENEKIDQSVKEVMDFIDQHKENVYMPTVTDSGSGLSQSLIWRTLPKAYCDNRISIGGWRSRFTSSVETWKRNGIDNPLKALLYKDNVYLYYLKGHDYSANLLLEYFIEHYDENAQMRITDQLGQYVFVSYYTENEV